MQITVEGRQYEIWTQPLDGYCGHADGVVWVNPENSDEELLEAILHEAGHLASPRLKEETIRRTAKVQAKILAKLMTFKRRAEAFK